MTPPEPHPKSPAPVRRLAPYVTAALIAIALRAWELDGQSLTGDEFEDLRVARRDTDFTDQMRGARRFPPLFHLAMRAWLWAFSSDVGARAFMVVIGLVTVAAMVALARAIGGRRAGLVAAFLAAISPFLVWYSTETRAYGVYLLCAAAATYAAWQLAHCDRWRDWLGFVVASLAGLYTHYFFSIYLVALVVAAGCWRAAALGSRRTLVALIAGALACLPLLPLMAFDLEWDWGFAQTTGFSMAALGYSFISALTGYTLGPSLRDLHTLDLGAALRQAAPWLALLAVAYAPLWIRGWLTLEHRSRAGLAVLATLPIVIVGLYSALGQHGFNPRHVVHIVVPLLTCAAVGLAHAPRREQWLTTGALCILAAVALLNRHAGTAYQNEDTRAAAQWIEQTDPTGAPILVQSGYMADVVNYYAVPKRLVLPAPDITAEGQGLEAARGMLDWLDAPLTWLVETRTFHGDPAGHLRRSLESEGRLTPKPAATFAGVTVSPIRRLTTTGKRP